MKGINDRKKNEKRYVNIVIFMLVITIGFLLTGCIDSIHMDTEKCAQIALEYLEDKYQTEFEIIYSREYGHNSGKYVEVLVYKKSEDKEYNYFVLIYPDSKSDRDGNGYYDSYRIIEDEYMSELFRPIVKKEFEKLLKEMGLNRFTCYIKIIDQTAGGFSPDFPIPNEEDFSLIEMLDNNHMHITCSIEMPVSEFSESIEEDIIKKFKPLISDDVIGFNIDAYSEEVYKEREEFFREGKEFFRGRKNMLLGIKHTSFSVKD